MATDTKMNEKKQRLLSLLREMFQLDQPDLDFGLYRIMHAKREQVEAFLETEFDQLIDKVFASRGARHEEEAKKEYEAARQQAIEFGAPDPEAAPKVQQARARYDAVRLTGGEDAEIYDHLHRFFSRYYDEGDFMSLRRYGKGAAGGAETYAVPYDGSEVVLHWANRDQYYIKTTENFAGFSFDPRKALQKDEKGISRQLFDAAASNGQVLKVHFRVVDAAEGAHNNVKASEKDERYFILDDDTPIAWEGTELVVRINYRPDSEKTGQRGKWQEKRNDQLVQKVLDALAKVTGEGKALSEEYHSVLSREVPKGKDKKQPLLARYVGQYTASNTMDYFIHKDLGGFLRRELDFYLKNEVLKLDDFVGSEDADVQGGLSEARMKAMQNALEKAQAIRLLAQRLVDFLAQLEDFQKKLWLKKKFVVETHYCITLDRIAEKFYPQIAANDLQREEWVDLYAIDEAEVGTGRPAYSIPLSVDFLKANPYLLVDTKFFDSSFRESLLQEIEELEQEITGVLIHSENSQALRFIQQKLSSTIDCVYADPPYNTSEEAFVYKNQYKHSSWLSMLHSSTSEACATLKDSGQLFVAIDDEELYRLRLCLDSVLPQGYLGTLAIQTNPRGRGINSHFATSHDYCLVYSPFPDETRIVDQPLTGEQAESYKHGDGEEAYRLLPFRRSGGLSTPDERPNSEFVLFFDKETKLLCAVGGERTLPYPEKYQTETVLTLNDEGTEVLEFPYETYVASMAHKVTAVMPLDSDGGRRVWRWSDREKILKAGREGDFILTAAGTVQLKDRIKEGRKPKTLWFDSKYDGSSHGTNLIQEILGGRGGFAYPKSIHTVRDSIYCAIGDNKNGWVLDFFGGSGTTGHAVTELNRADAGRRKFVLIEMGDYFDTVLAPRVKKVLYSREWRGGKPIDRAGVSSAIKVLRLESYEDCLNNLTLNVNPSAAALGEENALQRDYLLRYMLDVETRGSQTLLNVAQFRDPAGYQLEIKKLGSDERIKRNIDLVETFNWMLGLHIDRLHAGRRFAATFGRKPDPLLPEDANTRLQIESLTEAEEGAWWFRPVEGYIRTKPGDDRHRQSVLVLWRTLTDDPEQDAAVLEAFLAQQMKFDPSRREDKTLYDIIYINGTHNLPNLGKYGEVRLLEEEFHRRMWSQEEG